jgi:hypothetical protein
VSAGAALLHELDWQDVASGLSTTRPLAFPVDPMRRYGRGAPVPAQGSLEAVPALLEWAYGYRGEGRRRAPSAGALYPTEAFAVARVGPRWQVLYYDFAAHRLVATPGRAAEVAAALGLAADDVAVLLVSVLWRSAQRYGARCYRYCLLDAGHVAANLTRAAARFGVRAAPTPKGPSAAVERNLDLRDGEAVVCALRLRPRNARAVAPPPAPAPAADGRFAGVQSPPLSPVLRRIVAFHGRTLDAGLGAPALDRIACPDGDFEQLADARRSAPGFTGEQLPQAALERLLCVGRRAASGSLVVVPPRVGPAELARACQGQRIAATSAAALLVAAPLDELCARGHSGYRETVLHAGLVCSELYWEAARLGLGTSSIGGFSDDEVSRLSGLAGFHPVVIQVFGVEDRSVRKPDAARVVPSNVVELRKARDL